MSLILYDLVGKDPAIPFSPHCWKIKMALAHKGIEFETVPVTFTTISQVEDGAFTSLPAINHNGEKIQDSFEIALYLKNRYPDLNRQIFHGDGAVGLSRFVESWCNSTLHPWIATYSMLDICNMQGEHDKAYFRESREKRFGVTLEEFVAGREDRVGDLLNNRLVPLRNMLGKQDFLGGRAPLFADYIVFSAFQWLRVCSGLSMIPEDDPVKHWINRCLELHDSVAGRVPAAKG